MKTFGEKLRYIRKQLDLTQQEISDKLGVARSTYSLYEANKRRPNIDTLEKLKNLTGIDNFYILFKSDQDETVKDEARKIVASSNKKTVRDKESRAIPSNTLVYSEEFNDSSEYSPIRFQVKYTPFTERHLFDKKGYFFIDLSVTSAKEVKDFRLQCKYDLPQNVGESVVATVMKLFPDGLENTDIMDHYDYYLREINVDLYEKVSAAIRDAVKMYFSQFQSPLKIWMAH